MTSLFDTPIVEKHVRIGITAYKYRNGVIVISDQKYSGYSMTDAIRLFRKKFPAYPKADLSL